MHFRNFINPPSPPRKIPLPNSLCFDTRLVEIPVVLEKKIIGKNIKDSNISLFASLEMYIPFAKDYHEVGFEITSDAVSGKVKGEIKKFVRNIPYHYPCQTLQKIYELQKKYYLKTAPHY